MGMVGHGIGKQAWEISCRQLLPLVECQIRISTLLASSWYEDRHFVACGSEEGSLILGSNGYLAVRKAVYYRPLGVHAAVFSRLVKPCQERFVERGYRIV